MTDDPDAGRSEDPTVTAITAAPVLVVEVSVDYATGDQSASAGADYSPASGTLTVPAGETEATIAVEVLPDVLDEDDETYAVTLSDESGGTLVDGEGVGTILDNDPTPVMTISDVTVTEGDAGTVDAVLTVSLSSLSSFEVTASYLKIDGTASAGADYSATVGTVVIPPATLTATVVVPVLGDLLDEDDEVLLVQLSNPVRANLGDAAGW